MVTSLKLLRSRFRGSSFVYLLFTEISQMSIAIVIRPTFVLLFDILSYKCRTIRTFFVLSFLFFDTKLSYLLVRKSGWVVCSSERPETWPVQMTSSRKFGESKVTWFAFYRPFCILQTSIKRDFTDCFVKYSQSLRCRSKIFRVSSDVNIDNPTKFCEVNMPRS